MGASWFTEHVTSHDSHRHQLKRIVLKARTRFQQVTLADTYSFGRCLIINGEIQSAERDEFIYHECLVQPAMALHPRPREVLILGGGEGATVREILRHPSVHRVTMVDIDGDVVQFCQKRLGSWHQGSLHHRKTRLIIEDARKYIDQTRERFDIIISDLPTPACPAGRPSAADPAARLYAAPFYRRVMSRLKADGLFVAQSGSGNLLTLQFHAGVRRTLRKLFNVVRAYYAFVPSFDEPWSFVIASRRADPQKMTAARIDKKLGTISRKLRFYDGQTHEGLFRIPKYLRTT